MESWVPLLFGGWARCKGDREEHAEAWKTPYVVIAAIGKWPGRVLWTHQGRVEEYPLDN